jgi:hypothetical protein
VEALFPVCRQIPNITGVLNTHVVFYHVRPHIVGPLAGEVAPMGTLIIVAAWAGRARHWEDRTKMEKEYKDGDCIGEPF